MSNNSSSSAAGGGGSNQSLNQMMRGLEDAIKSNSEGAILHYITLLSDGEWTVEDAINLKGQLSLLNKNGKFLTYATVAPKYNTLMANLTQFINSEKINMRNDLFGAANKFGRDTRRLASAMTTQATDTGNIGIVDYQTTNRDLRGLARAMDELASLHEDILNAKGAEQAGKLAELEAQARAREAAITAALEAQNRVIMEANLQNALSGRVPLAELIQTIEKSQKDIQASRRMSEDTQKYIERIYVTKFKKYIDTWRELIPSPEGVARTAGGIALMPAAASALGLRDAVQSMLNAGPSPIPTGQLTSFVSNAVSNGAVQVGGLIGLTYLIAVYGPSLRQWMGDAYDTFEDQFGDLVNYASGIVRPYDEAITMRLGLTDQGPSEYNSFDAEAKKILSQNLRPDQQARLLQIVNTPIPGGQGQTGNDVLQAAASGNQQAQQQVASALEQVASRAPSRAGTSAPSASNSQDDYSSFGLGGRRKSRSTKKRRSTKRSRSAKRRNTKRRRSTKRRATKRRR